MTTGEREGHFRVLYESTRPRILAYALRRMVSPEDAADVVAETFAISWRRLDVVPSGDEALLWLYATCRRVIANDRRGEHRRSELTVRVGAQLRRAVNDRSEPGADALLAARALERLRDDDRELLMLVAWEGLSSAELAHVLECSPTAARIRLHRARARLLIEMERVGLVSTHGPSSGHSPLRERTPKSPKEA